MKNRQTYVNAVQRYAVGRWPGKIGARFTATFTTRGRRRVGASAPPSDDDDAHRKTKAAGTLVGEVREGRYTVTAARPPAAGADGPAGLRWSPVPPPENEFVFRLPSGIGERGTAGVK